jgi:AcrR family transcriptional regulator
LADAMTADRPPRADAARNRIRVLEAAETMFTERGIEVPVEEVAKAAGVGVGTVYRHYPTKRHLVEAIVRTHLGVTDKARSTAGTEPMAEIASDLTAALTTLLDNAQQADAVRPELRPTDVLQTLYGLSAAAEHYRWDASGRSHAIAIAVDGLRPR